MYSIDPTRALRYGCYGLAGLLLAVGVVRWRPRDSSDNPAYDALSQAHSRRMAADAVALDSARRALVQDKAQTERTVVRYSSLRDTLNVHDTVQVQVFVARADSVVRACTALVESCDRFRVRAESSLASLTLDRDRWRLTAESLQPSGARRFWDRVKLPLVFGLGLYAGARVTR